MREARTRPAIVSSERGAENRTFISLVLNFSDFIKWIRTPVTNSIVILVLTNITLHYIMKSQ